MNLTIMPISQQQRNRSCGLVALESVRKFFSQLIVQASRQAKKQNPVSFRCGFAQSRENLAVHTIYATHPNIAQHHLGCADDLWESISPRGQQAYYLWPNYFAPVSDLMWARHTLHALSNQNSAQETGHVLPSLCDKMWLALASIAPRFVHDLRQISWSIDQVIGMMATPILDGQKEALGAVLQRLSLPCPGNPLPQSDGPSCLKRQSKIVAWDC